MKTILLITTGGTLDKVYFDALSEYQVGNAVAPEILQRMNVNFCYEHKEICRKDSLEITDQDRALIKQAIDGCEHDHVLVTHGTDTMVQTAQFLGEQPEKTIVFTGAMQPAAFANTDAIFNIGTAIGALNSAPKGVYVAMSGQVFLASKVYKNYETKRFEDNE
ncbi:asparaginase [Bermanella marisrubri]|uniref:Asparaginase n=1 Tax=Bermanella marisrubri TaxID=207949 RepID=Q1N660_9GAMM|nr:asparaginase domain-containing protein [Bermanella marisrubri]EAT13732.1 asparaginase [Oceanobacter sp. RED65] [Bermanella marisrubri]QIZ84508.1 asparaginase [Bermanella marisrubri]